MKCMCKLLKKIFLILVLSGYSHSTYAQQPADANTLKKMLAAIRERDQKTRTGKDSVEFTEYIDSTNLVEVEAIISQYGWPGKSFVGIPGNQTCFLVIQHSDSATRAKYLPVLQKSVDDGESFPSDLALLQDRVLMDGGAKQIYGSQIIYDRQGNPVFYPIEDEINVNARRKKMGLQSIEKYARYFDIDYKPPVK